MFPIRDVNIPIRKDKRGSPIDTHVSRIYYKWTITDSDYSTSFSTWAGMLWFFAKIDRYFSSSKHLG